MKEVTASVRIEFSKKQLRRLERIAKNHGQSVQEYVEIFTLECILDNKDPQEEIDKKIED